MELLTQKTSLVGKGIPDRSTNNDLVRGNSELEFAIKLFS